MDSDETVIRSRKVAVQRCEAITTQRLYSAPHRCPYAAVTHLDGKWLCQKHADLWVIGENLTARDAQREEETP